MNNLDRALECISELEDLVVDMSFGSDAERHPLQTIFDQCIEQAASGKGEERHGHGVPFMEQPWHQIAERQGLGFLAGQAEKKIGEASAMIQANPGRDGVEFWQKEIRGAINYLAMAMLYVEEQVAELTANETGCGDCDGCGCNDNPAF